MCKRAGQFEHWLIQEDGHVCDLFKSLTTIFECTPEYFFRFFNEAAGDDSRNDLVYHHQIEQYAQSVKYHEFPRGRTSMRFNMLLRRCLLAPSSI